VPTIFTLTCVATHAENAKPTQSEPTEVVVFGSVVQHSADTVSEAPEQGGEFPVGPLRMSAIAAPSTNTTVASSDQTPKSGAGNVLARARSKTTAKQVISRKGTRSLTLTRQALSYRGAPYRWGGCSVRTGIDCSGFTRYLYERQGIELPHSAKSQFEKGRPVEITELRPGDLVFFNIGGSLTHVGMYIGEGKFIHASNPAKGIKVDELSARFYAPRFAGARRYTS
jgi:cell wall-associated NlpC family hydrolase